MPQLDTSPWFMTILSTLITLFIVLQMKFKEMNFHNEPSMKMLKTVKSDSPWKEKWTKICLPHSLPLH
nr:ATP synthase F0 subunit 8 [Geomys bursarius]